MNDLFKGGAPQSQQNINANEIDIGFEDLQASCDNETSQAFIWPTDLPTNFWFRETNSRTKSYSKVSLDEDARPRKSKTAKKE